jgi:transposase
MPSITPESEGAHRHRRRKRQRFRKETVLIADGALIPTRDHCWRRYRASAGPRALEAPAGPAVRGPRLRLRQVPPPPAARGITPKIARKGTTHGSGLGRTRWVVERTFAWLHHFKRLRIRCEIRADLHLGLLQLACSIICLRRLRTSF